MTKKVLGMVLCGVMTVGMITGCGGSDSSTTNDAGNTSADAAQEISIVSREDGSGTRGAFIELFGVEDEENGEKVDKTTEEATIANSTEIVMTTVSGDKNAIGYCSLGSLNDLRLTVQSQRLTTLTMEVMQLPVRLTLQQRTRKVK